MKNVLVCVGAAALGCSSLGAVVSVTGQVSHIAPPPSLAFGVFADKTKAYVINERQGVQFSGGVDKYLPTVGVAYTTFNLAPALLPGPTWVDSHLIHFDNNGEPSPYPSVTGTVTFDGPIIAIICSLGRLDLSDAALGAPGTTYAAGELSRGISSVIDTFKLLSPNTIQFTLANGQAMDDIRVLTVPGPGAVAVGLAGLIVARRRR
jgi:hypothetical protein